MTNVNNISDIVKIIKDNKLPSKSPELISQMQSASDQFDGGWKAVSNTYFPCPSDDPSIRLKFEASRKHFPHINRVKPTVNLWKSVLTRDIKRDIQSAPNLDEITDFVNSYEYQEAISNAVENTALYGFTAVVPLYNTETGELRIWLPNPMKTTLIVDELDIYNLVAVIESDGNKTQFVSKFGEGVITKDKQIIQPRNWTACPAIVFYANDRRHCGSIYGGGSFVQNAVKFSIAETKSTYNVLFLQQDQARSILVLTMDIEKANQQANIPDAKVKSGIGGDSKMLLDKDSSANFITPSPALQESMSVKKMLASDYATIDSLPLDIIAPELISSPSAESARIRALPFYNLCRSVIPRFENYETKLIEMIAYIIQYNMLSESVIRYHQFKKELKIVVKNNTQILIKSDNEITANAISLVSAGLKRRSDAIRELNDKLTDEEIEEMISQYETSQQQERNVADNAFKRRSDATINPDKDDQETGDV